MTDLNRFGSHISRRWVTGASLAILSGVMTAPLQARSAEASGSFSAFLTGIWPEAHAHGVSRSTFEAAFADVSPDQEVLAKTHRQAEFTKATGQYLDTAVSDKRIATGTARYGEWASWLAKAERQFGVDRYVILGVWGLETNFGGYAGGDYVIRSLATLAFARYRGDYFRRELIAALAILQAGHVDPGHMMGSWAGAMGQTQFMPTSFKAYAVDFDGDGKRNIWTSVPDAIGSTANYLKKRSWTSGETWGYEVLLPTGLGAANGTRASFSNWATRGVLRADGGGMPRSGTGALIMPEGRAGPAFLVTSNFKVIKTYNNSTSYALGVALLGDRIAGWGPLKAQWPSAGRTVARS